MNTPNKLTVLRMILVPFFVASLLAGDSLPHHNLIALVIFAAASYTDHLDGKIARSRNLVTTFGKFMDPLADKIMVISALVCFVSQGLADVWLVLFFRYLLELVSLGILPAFTVFGGEAAFWFALFGNALLWIAAILAVISGIIYLKQNWKIVAREM